MPIRKRYATINRNGESGSGGTAKIAIWLISFAYNIVLPTEGLAIFHYHHLNFYGHFEPSLRWAFRRAIYN